MLKGLSNFFWLLINLTIGKTNSWFWLERPIVLLHREGLTLNLYCFEVSRHLFLPIDKKLYQQSMLETYEINKKYGILCLSSSHFDPMAWCGLVLQIKIGFATMHGFSDQSTERTLIASFSDSLDLFGPSLNGPQVPESGYHPNPFVKKGF